MFTQNEKEWILEAINHLKRRKARPDFSRISLRMKRKHHLTITQTRQLLDSLVESGVVVKAVYKNNTSYRDVSKWKKGKLGGQILNSSRMLKRFVRAITSCQSTTEGRKGTGVSATAIEECLSRQNEDKCFLSGAALRDAIENEVHNGFLHKVEIDNESFFSVNVQKVNDLNRTLEASKSMKREVALENGNSIVVSDSSQHEDELESASNNSNIDFVRLAISETEKGGSGSTFNDIESWIEADQSYKFSSLKGSKTSLLEFLKSQVEAGNICELAQDNITRYSLTKEADVCPKISKQIEGKGDKNTSSYFDQEQINASGKVNTVSLRPPSKRKRIIKNHGPDFEMEIPTKSKTKFTAFADTKEYSFPTALDSPVSEKSETTIDQSFKYDQLKKRGRPKKEQKNARNVHVKDVIDASEDDNSRQDGPSEQSSVCQEDNDDCVSEAPLPDASTWTSQQVADYFLEQGYQEESKQMLENELDGVALGLLRRSDIVGPPAGGMLKIQKLGVALKLFRDVRNLLYQGNAENYIDPYEERPFYRS